MKPFNSKTSWWVLVLCGAFSACGGCHWPGVGATNGTVTVTPDFACPGSTVRVTWTSRAGSTVDVRSPSGALLGSTANGSATFTASTSGNVSLTVNGESSRAAFEVASSPQPLATIIGVRCGLLTSGYTGIASTAVPLIGPRGVSRFDPRLQLDWVQVPRGQAGVEHDGNVFFIEGGAATPAFGAAGGNYRVTALLDPTETCGFPTAFNPNPPSSLLLNMQASCR